MSFSSQNGHDRRTGAIEAEETLRLIAALPAPEGIEERVKAGLKSAPRQAVVIDWPLRSRWIQNAAMRAAAAAAIVMVVAGGGWEVYSHIHVAAEPAAVAAPPPVTGQSGLSAAGTKRVPQTLEGPVIASPVIANQKTSKHAAADPATHGKSASAKKPKAPVQVQP